MRLHKLEKLLNLKYKRKKLTAECGDSGEDVPINLMLEGVYEREEIREFEQKTTGERERQGRFFE